MKGVPYCIGLEVLEQLFAYFCTGLLIRERVNSPRCKRRLTELLTSATMFPVSSDVPSAMSVA